MSEKKRITVYLDEQLLKDLKHRAIDEDRDVSSIVSSAVEKYLASVTKSGTKSRNTRKGR